MSKKNSSKKASKDLELPVREEFSMPENDFGMPMIDTSLTKENVTGTFSLWVMNKPIDLLVRCILFFVGLVYDLLLDTQKNFERERILRDTCNRLNAKCEDLKAEKEKLEKTIAQATAALAVKNEELVRLLCEHFGSSSEQVRFLKNLLPDKYPLDEDMIEDDDSDKEDEEDPKKKQKGQKDPKNPPQKRGPRKGKKQRTRDILLGAMATVAKFLPVPEAPEGFIFQPFTYDNTKVVKNIPAHTFVEEIFSPVYMVIHKATGKIVDIVHSKRNNDTLGGERIWPGSLATPSLLSYCLYSKYVLHMPFYRQAQAFALINFPLSRNTMTEWSIKAAFQFFYPIYKYMSEYVRDCPYQQCDETTMKIIGEDRKISYIWIHSTGALWDGPVVAVYAPGPTRSTDHLRDFYKGRPGTYIVITCDGYISYKVLATENGGRIIIAGCWVHARRKWADAIKVLPKNLTPEQKEKRIEYRALKLINKLFEEEAKLVDMTAEERLEERQKTSRKAVEDYYKFLDELNTESPAMTDTAKKAVNYSLNQKEFLCEFLNDGNICCHNNAAENLARSVALGRKNYLFNVGLNGAIASCIIRTLVQTAILNGGNSLYYLQYLLEKMPAIMRPYNDIGINELPDTPETNKLIEDELLPWSPAYLEYEEKLTKGTSGVLAALSEEQPELPQFQCPSNRNMAENRAYVEQYEAARAAQQQESSATEPQVESAQPQAAAELNTEAEDSAQKVSATSDGDRDHSAPVQPTEDALSQSAVAQTPEAEDSLMVDVILDGEPENLVPVPPVAATPSQTQPTLCTEEGSSTPMASVAPEGLQENSVSVPPVEDTQPQVSLEPDSEMEESIPMASVTPEEPPEQLVPVPPVETTTSQVHPTPCSEDESSTPMASVAPECPQENSVPVPPVEDTQPQVSLEPDSEMEESISMASVTSKEPPEQLVPVPPVETTPSQASLSPNLEEEPAPTAISVSPPESLWEHSAPMLPTEGLRPQVSLESISGTADSTLMVDVTLDGEPERRVPVPPAEATCLQAHLEQDSEGYDSISAPSCMTDCVEHSGAALPVESARSQESLPWLGRPHDSPQGENTPERTQVQEHPNMQPAG